MSKHESALTPELAFARHNHSGCVTTALRQVQDQCRLHGLRLTPARQRVLEILLESHAALGAYDILARLAAEGMGSQPPVVYRALDFLVEHGFAHKIQRLNAFLACSCPGQDHSPAFLICRSCKSVAETAAGSLATGLADSARTIGFEIERSVIEALGLCPACQKAQSA